MNEIYINFRTNNISVSSTISQGANIQISIVPNPFIMDPDLGGIQEVKLFIIPYISNVVLIIKTSIFGLFYVSVGIIIWHRTDESLSVFKLKWPLSAFEVM
jgi:hypothetical protein